MKRKKPIRKKAVRKGERANPPAPDSPTDSAMWGSTANDFSSGAWPMTLFWYSQSFYNVIQSLGYDKAKEIAEAAGNFSLEYPLWMTDEKKGGFKQFDLPHIGEKSGPYLIAVQGAFLVWTQKQLTDNPMPDSPILKACEDGLRAWRLLKE